MTDIIEKVQLSKLPEYVQMTEKKGYVMRQQFISKDLMPLLKQCFCGQYVNPDQILVLCPSCEKPYHAECLMKQFDQGNVNCDSCREVLSSLQITDRIKDQLQTRSFTVVIQQNQQKNQDQQRAIQIEEEEEEEQLDRNERRIDLEKIVKKIKTKDGPIQSKVQIVKQDSNNNGNSRDKNKPHEITTAQPNPPEQQKQQSQPFKNISTQAIEKMKSWVERYRQMESNATSFEKKRQEVREKFFSVIFYGIEELKDMYQRDPKSITQLEKEIINNSETALFQYIKNLALDIEVYIHIKFNTQYKNKLEPLYVDRCKLIYLHMKDDKNLELRRKVISKEFQAQDLSTRDERDLYNPEKRKQTQEIAMRVIELNQKDNDEEQKIIKDIEEVSFSRNQSINEEIQITTQKKDGHSSKNLLKEKMMEYSVEKSIMRFKKRIADELNDKERLQILASLEQYQLNQ
ncbi:unnamed protein product [Paramecium primaurelia]|uniref:TFIIS central domain-containing protein n=1 Tax=Paramecium primaurelia TaxID=5886 RepID=A0A8S1Q262_PARPR|nr:unnamed protein product [Paramecium primaurelia]